MTKDKHHSISYQSNLFNFEDKCIFELRYTEMTNITASSKQEFLGIQSHELTE